MDERTVDSCLPYTICSSWVVNYMEGFWMKFKVSFAELMFDVNEEVFMERMRQNEKWGIQRHDNGKWLSILTEEFGEVGQALNRINFPDDAKETDADNLYEELIQVAAVASAWAEQIKEGK